VEIDPTSTAVLALHFQREVVAPDGAFGPFFAEQAKSRNVLANTAKVLEGARGAGIPIVYARVTFPPGHPGLTASSPLYGIVLEHNALVQGTPAVEIVDEVAPGRDDVVLDHEGMSAFVGGELDRLFADRGIDTVVVTGVATNVIVEGTARDAANRGLATYVLADCCSAGDDAAHDASVATMGLITNGIATSDEFLAGLGAGQPA
jgi:nicotinamidase-related amidase